MSAAGVCGASPLGAPAGLPLRSAPRRAQRAASEERARNERATSEERFRTSPARSSRVGRSGGGRQAVGRRSALAGRSVGGRWSVGLRAPSRPARPSASTARGVPFAVRPLRRAAKSICCRMAAMFSEIDMETPPLFCVYARRDHLSGRIIPSVSFSEVEITRSPWRKTRMPAAPSALSTRQKPSPRYTRTTGLR